MCQELLYGETEVGAEINRSFEALCERRGASQLSEAGRIIVASVSILDGVSRNNFTPLGHPAHRVFGDNPNGRAEYGRFQIPWNIPDDVWSRIVGWSVQEGFVAPAITDDLFRSALALELEEEGVEFVSSLAIKPYTNGERNLDNEFSLWKLGGYRRFGECLDR
jgi:hypothetical protein